MDMRQKYLAWVYDFGNNKIHGKSVIDYFKMKDGLSFWWMSLFVEKSPWKSPGIIDAIRLFALEDLLLKNKPELVQFSSASRELHKVVKDLCDNLSIKFEGKVLKRKSISRPKIKVLYYLLPHSLRALYHFSRYVYDRWPLRSKKKIRPVQTSEPSVFFLSYFIYPKKDRLQQDEFYNHYWDTLPTLLHENGIQTNWLEHYLENSTSSSASDALKYLEDTTGKNIRGGFHYFLDSFLSLKVLLKVLVNIISIQIKTVKITNLKNLFIPKGAHFNLWPIMKNDWYSSFNGASAVKNLLIVELIDEALKAVPQQNVGLYVSENQSWERAFIYRWKKHHNKKLIAVAHSTVRFWDLRYFNDDRTFKIEKNNALSLPRPHYTALNGKKAVEFFLETKFPENEAIKCEALRYCSLINTQNKVELTHIDRSKFNVFVLGDYMDDGIEKMMSVLLDTYRFSSEDIQLTLKPHPHRPIRLEDYPDLDLTIVTNPLSEILHNFDMAYAGNLTSAAIDAYLSNLPVAIFLDDTTLNFSPLRGARGVFFIHDARDLDQTIKAVKSGKVDKNTDAEEFFYLEKDLPRWKELLLSQENSNFPEEL